MAGTVVPFETPGHLSRVVSEEKMSRLSLTDQRSTKSPALAQNARAGYPLGFGVLAYGEGRATLDKSEGVVKSIVVLGGANSTADLPEKLRTKALEISR